MDLTGKKLLILGGGATSIDIVEAARAMGVYTIVTDWYDTKRSPAKLVADEYWNEEIFKPERIAQLIKEHHVDGVITGFTDSYLLQYQRICELSGLPCYATKEVFETTIDKAKFKKHCIDNGVPVIPEYDLATFDPNMISDNHKIIIKPVDNSGSRGVIACKEANDFQRCLDYALSFSQKKEIIIERYMDMDSWAASYTIQDGVISLSTLNDRLEHKSSETAAITTAGIYPSKYLERYLEEIDPLIRKMYKAMDVTNGVLSVQGFVDVESFYVMEMGYRLTGGQHYNFSKYENGISALEQLIHFALTGSMADFSIADKDNPCFQDLCLNLCILGKEAKVARIEGREFVENLPELIHANFLKGIGDQIGPDGNTSQKIANLHLVLKDVEDMRRVVSLIQEHFHVYNDAEEDLVLPLME